MLLMSLVDSLFTIDITLSLSIYHMKKGEEMSRSGVLGKVLGSIGELVGVLGQELLYGFPYVFYG